MSLEEYRFETEFDAYSGIVWASIDKVKCDVQLALANDMDYVSARLTPAEARILANHLLEFAQHAAYLRGATDES